MPLTKIKSQSADFPLTAQNSKISISKAVLGLISVKEPYPQKRDKRMPNLFVCIILLDFIVIR